MKTNSKKIISIILAVVLIVSAVPFGGFVGINLGAVKASALEASGTCGKNVTYTFDEETGTLTISGTGEMEDYYHTSSPFNNSSTIKSVIIEDGVKSVGANAFNWATSIESVTIGNGVTSIGNHAFDNCESLKSINIPDNVTFIDSAAFYSCESLESVTISDNVEGIGGLAFYKTAYYKNSKNWTDGALYVGKYLVDAKDTITSCDIKDGTLLIADDAFLWCGSLENVTIPDSVRIIGENSFGDCESLKSIKIGNGVESIGFAAFSDCKSLTSVKIGSNVTSIGSEAFKCCDSLSRVMIPKNVTSIGHGAFGYIHDEDSGKYVVKNGFVIYGYKESKAETYANKNGITFIDLDSHTHSYTATVVAPTCTKNGSTIHECICSDTYEDNYSEATGHSFVNGVCTNCGEKVSCSCSCHKSGIVNFFWKIAMLFYKLFRTHQVCDCGAYHY